MIAEASSDYDGALGDSSGNEVHVGNWYSYPWNCVLRHSNERIRNTIARLSIDGANNNNIGYTWGGNSLLPALQQVGWEPSKIQIKCGADCSLFVSDMVIAAGNLCNDSKLAGVGPGSTHGMAARLTAAGFQLLTDSKYLSGDQYLLRGDILLNHALHTAVNVGDGASSSSDDWTQTGTSDGTSDGTQISGDQLYSSEYTRADGIVREFCYLTSKYEKTITPTPLKFSVINYTAMVSEVADIFGLVTGSPGSSGTGADDVGTGSSAVIDPNNIAKSVWDYFISKGYTPEMTAGIMGNMERESYMSPYTVQGANSGDLNNPTNKSYIDKVDNGSYSESQFVYDRVGFGIVQFTFSGLKKMLYDACKQKNVSISDLQTQLEEIDKAIFMPDYCGDLGNYVRQPGISVDQATILFEQKYEKAGVIAMEDRLSFAHKYYNQFAKATSV